MSRSEDLMHEAFVKLWENCQKVSFEKAKSFVFTVVNNLFINLVRHHKIVFQFEKEYLPNNAAEDPSLLLQEKEFKEKLEAGIANLTDGQREVYLMSRINKMKCQDIANALGISVKAVEKKNS